MRLAALLGLCAMVAVALSESVIAHPTAPAFAAAAQEHTSVPEARHHVSRLKRYRRRGSSP